MNERCFALKEKMGHPPFCACCEGNCPGHTACAFYKPVWRFQHEREKKYARLAALPEMMQEHIANKYYRGMMPWRKDRV